MDGYDGTSRCVGSPEEGQESALYRVVVPRQNLVVRINGLRPDDPEDGYLPAVRPYGLLRTAWAIWREVPDVPLRGAFSLALDVRREEAAEVLLTTEFLAQHVQARLWARHHLTSRLERFG